MPTCGKHGCRFQSFLERRRAKIKDLPLKKMGSLPLTPARLLQPAFHHGPRKQDPMKVERRTLDVGRWTLDVAQGQQKAPALPFAAISVFRFNISGLIPA